MITRRCHASSQSSSMNSATATVIDKECEASSSVVAVKSTHAKQDKFRWIVLTILCICVYSMIYCYDNPFALQEKLENEYNLTAVEYNLLYGIYGYVNAILPLISGLLIDCIGLNSSAVLFYTLIVIGQTVWVFGCILSSYPLMLLGRGIFGAGTQPFQISRKYYCYKYVMCSFFFILLFVFSFGVYSGCVKFLFNQYY